MKLRFKRCVDRLPPTSETTHILHCDANIYEYMPCAFKRIRVYISCVAIFFGQKNSLPHLVDILSFRSLLMTTSSPQSAILSFLF
jgi:hypothetical protein